MDKWCHKPTSPDQNGATGVGGVAPDAERVFEFETEGDRNEHRRNTMWSP
jgi:hypothetical protein